VLNSLGSFVKSGVTSGWQGRIRACQHEGPIGQQLQPFEVDQLDRRPIWAALRIRGTRVSARANWQFSKWKAADLKQL
jgi:hypothetical protein